MNLNRLFILSLLLLIAAGADAKSRYFTIDEQMLLDKIKGGWAGQTIGCTYGGPTEFRYKGRMIPQTVNIPWYDNYCKDIFQKTPGLYDDVYMDLTVLQVIQENGLATPASVYANAFAHAKYKLWHANQAMRYNVLHGIMPPQSGYWKNNPHADDIDFQIESDCLGMISPGMPVTAAALADTVGHIMNYGDGWYGGVFTSAMYTFAFISTDMEHVVTQALKTIPEKTGFHDIISYVLSYWKQHPDDWRQCWRELQKRYAFEKGCPDGVYSTFNIDAKMNAAFYVMGLLYGKGDFFQTMDIATRCGADSDCNPSTAAGIWGVMYGWKKIPEKYQRGIDLCENYDFPYTKLSLAKVYPLNLSLLAQNVKANGGKVKGKKYYIKLQEPKPVRYEQSFEGCKPAGRIAANYNIDSERSFDFTGTGCVLKGQVNAVDKAGDPSYVAKLEATIDGKKVEDIDMPADFLTRKHEIFWRYDMPHAKHTLTIKWLNPDPHYSIKCWGLLVYDTDK